MFFLSYKQIAIAKLKPLVALASICVCISLDTFAKKPNSVSDTLEFAPIFVAAILFTSSVMLPADVTGDPDIENSEPDCVMPILVTVPVFDGVTWV